MARHDRVIAKIIIGINGSNVPDLTTAMIFAAGRGSRMRHLSENCPKPLLEVAGKSILKRLIDHLPEHGIDRVIVNSWYHSDMVKNHLADVKKPTIELSEETELLETGGGAKNALRLIGSEPFWAFNGDMLWLDVPGKSALLSLMKEQWDPEKMDMLLMLYPKTKLRESGLRGDYHIAANGRLTRTHGEEADYIFAGARICKPELLQEIEKKKFSFLDVFDLAEKRGRLYGVVFEGEWFHLSTPELLDDTNSVFKVRGL